MKVVLALLSSASFTLLCAGTAGAQEVKPIVVLKDSAPAMYGRSAKVKTTIEAIDVAARELTFKGPKGRSMTLRVVERVKNLPELKIGDEVTVRYNESVALELRKAQEGEEVGTVEHGAQTPEAKAQHPAAPARTKLVTTVEAVSPREKTVTVIGPAGNLIDLYVRDPDVLSSVAVGDKVVATYTEALAVAIEVPKSKQKPKPKKRRQ